jgi:hypothetical protein
MKHCLVGPIVLLTCLVAPAFFQLPAAAAELDGSTSKPYDSTQDYLPRKIKGWRVLVNKRLLQGHPKLCNRTLTLLWHQLYQIERAVPAEAVAKLREVPIWVEVADPHHRCMCYHPGANWLRENGMNPDKEGAIEIANARNFLSWTRQQPWMVLHELAHAYHDQFLGGYDNREILAVYRNAVAAKAYETVLRINGEDARAYALNNQMEYFAELSEAYFGTNDFYPYVRSELKRHDPNMVKLLEKLWGVKPTKSK